MNILHKKNEHYIELKTVSTNTVSGMTQVDYFVLLCLVYVHSVDFQSDQVSGACFVVCSTRFCHGVVSAIR